MLFELVCETIFDLLFILYVMLGHLTVGDDPSTLLLPPRYTDWPRSNMLPVDVCNHARLKAPFQSSIVWCPAIFWSKGHYQFTSSCPGSASSFCYGHLCYSLMLYLNYKLGNPLYYAILISSLLMGVMMKQTTPRLS
jgi:hypothetical protein